MVHSRGVLSRLAASIVGLALIAPSAFAADPSVQKSWKVRGRLIDVALSDSSGAVTGLPGSGVDIRNDVTGELDFSYQLGDHVGLELVLTLTRHDINGTGSIAALGKIGETRLLPPTLMAQYLFSPAAKTQPYAGMGLTFANFLSEKSTASLDTALGGPTTIEINDKVGLALQLGSDFEINDKWFFNVDAKYILLDSAATLTTGATTRRVDISVDPWIFAAGVGTRF